MIRMKFEMLHDGRRAWWIEDEEAYIAEADLKDRLALSVIVESMINVRAQVARLGPS